jgi:hypothetical protein
VSRNPHGVETDQVGPDTGAEALQLIREHSRDIRASLASILATTDALRRVDSEKLEPADRLPYLDAIWRDGSRVLDLVNRILTASPAAAQEPQGVRNAPALQASNANPTTEVVRPPTREGSARGGTAYLGWLRSRLAQIETLGRNGETGELASLARQLKDSAATTGFTEISEAAAAVQRLSETPGTQVDAGVEILRRVVNRAIRKTSGAAA